METPLGKQFKRQEHYQIKTSEQAAEETALIVKYGQEEGAVDIAVWFAIRGFHKDPVRKAGMLAFTKMRKAKPEVFDEIFAAF